MTPADPTEPTQSALTPAEPEQPVPRGRRRRWLIALLLMLVLAAALGLGVGASIVLRGRSFGTPLAPDAAARPTFVIATLPSPSPAPSGSPRPATVTSSTTDEYVVEPGDTLRSIAERVYGDAAQWSRIYDANRTTIGPDPDTISAGTHLRIPRP
jgi:nucleoid-associated protein YgaU